MEHPSLRSVEPIEYDYAEDGAFMLEFNKSVSLPEAAQYVFNVCRTQINGILLAKAKRGKEEGYMCHGIGDKEEPYMITVGGTGEMNTQWEVINRLARDEIFEFIHRLLEQTMEQSPHRLD